MPNMIVKTWASGRSDETTGLDLKTRKVGRAQRPGTAHGLSLF
jgi:hypothetical protein